MLTDFEPITGPLGPARRETLAALLAAAEADGARWCVGHTAYLLATAWHECQFASRGICADPAGLAEAMRAGTITGKRLGQYILGGRGDPVSFRHCRKVVGGMDAAEEVAEVAGQFAEALIAGGWK